MVTTRAALLREAQAPLSVEEIEYGPLRAKEVLVQVAAASACHSDLHAISSGGPHLPLVIGHEAAGCVADLGPDIEDLSIGDKVAFSFVPSCGTCPACVRGYKVACTRGTSIGGDGRPLEGSYRGHSWDGYEVGQMVRLGAFADHTVVHRDSLQVLPDDTDLRIAALLSCGFVTGAGAAINIAAVRPGETVVIVGVGGVGTAAIQGAVVAGASEVIAVDVDDDKLQSASEFGASSTINARTENWVAKVRALTDGLGADKGISCVGWVDSGHLAEFMDSVRVVGHGVVVGAGNPKIALSDMGRKSLTWTLYGSYDPKADQLLYLRLHKAGRLKLGEMITQTYDLQSVNECLRDLSEGKLIRGLIELEND